jgi:DNA (cytosine-5)-methyltransferase 1
MSQKLEEKEEESLSDSSSEESDSDSNNSSSEESDSDSNNSSSEKSDNETTELKNCIDITINDKKILTFVDLFCGIGGFHIALNSIGLKCVFSSDIDEKCRNTYYENFGIKPYGDIRNVSENMIPDFDVLCGGFPCQSFSHSGKQKGFDDITRGTLFFEICRFLKLKNPKYFILENVKNLKTHDKGKTWKIIYKNLIELGYQTHEDPIVLSPHHFGIPQHRERVFIVGVRNDIGILPIIPPIIHKKEISIYKILQDEKEIDSNLLKKIKLKKNEIECLNIWDNFIQHFKIKLTKIPGFPLWADEWGKNYDISDLPKWKINFINKNRLFYEDNKDYIDKWLENANTIELFISSNSKRKIEWQCGNFQENDSLWNLIFQFRPSGIRIKRPTYSPALVAMCQIVCIGKLKRILTPIEVSRLQCFPNNYKINNNINQSYKQFGNSVNVDVVKYVAKILLNL